MYSLASYFKALLFMSIHHLEIYSTVVLLFSKPHLLTLPLTEKADIQRKHRVDDIDSVPEM